MRTTLLLLTLALACRGRGAEKPERTEKKPAVETPTRAKPAEGEPAPEGPQAAAKGGGAPLVLFIVLDTVRADHLSLCGYERPTSPYLEKLRDEFKVAWTCDARSPGPWTIPSHASYFTGLTVPEHGSDKMGIKFSKDIPTLSEIMKGKGYQPVLLSANPTLSKESGLQRGFEFIRVPKTLVDIRGEDVRKELKQLIDTVDASKPMFLTVNLIDAHDPYPRVPADVGWVPAQDSLTYNVHDLEQDTAYHRYFLGGMPEERQREYEQRALNGYDYGISIADRNVGEVIRLLRHEGWLANGFRMVITSDHGEFLGEHHLLRHGCYIYEPVTKVPFIYYDSALPTQAPLPAPLSAMASFWLLSEGKLPDQPIPVTSFSNERAEDIKKGSDMAALWVTSTEKIVWDKGKFLRFDLAADPNEERPTELPADHPERARLEKMAADHERHLEEVRKLAVDPALQEQLKQLGYWEETPPTP